MELRRSYLSAGGRDMVMDRRRDVRHRRAMPWIPDGIEIEKAKIAFRDSLPEYVINRSKSRLQQNPINISVHVRGDAKPTLKRRGENLEDWFRGVVNDLDPLGQVDDRVCEHQCADGDAWAQLEFYPDFTPPHHGDEPDGDYDDLVEDARKDWGLPLSLSAPDPRMVYCSDNTDRPAVVAKVFNRPLIDVRDKWLSSGMGLRVDPDGKLERYLVLGGYMPPSPTVFEHGRLVRVVEIADCYFIYHCIFPQTVPSGAASNEAFGDMPGSTPNLILINRYPNPLGRPPFFRAPARRTSDPDPAFAFYPLCVEMLETAEYVNQWQSIRMLKGLVEASMPVHYKPILPQAQSENAAPKNLNKLLRPGFLQADGTFNQIPNTPLEDFDKFSTQLQTIENMYNMSIMGALQSGQVGRSTPAWSIMQINEEQTGFLREPLDSRATMWREILLAVAKLVREKYGKTGKVYVRSNRPDKYQPEHNVDIVTGLAAQDFDVPYRLTIDIDAMTQSQRAANTEYGRRLWQEGSISQETYLEAYVGVIDPAQEQARKDRETLMVPMRKAAMGIGLQLGANVLFQVHGQIVLPILQAAGFPQPNGEPVQGGVPGGQQAANPAQAGSTDRGTHVLDALKLPGQGLPLGVPEAPQQRPDVRVFGGGGGGGSGNGNAGVG